MATMRNQMIGRAVTPTITDTPEARITKYRAARQIAGADNPEKLSVMMKQGFKRGVEKADIGAGRMVKQGIGNLKKMAEEESKKSVKERILEGALSGGIGSVARKALFTQVPVPKLGKIAKGVLTGGGFGGAKAVAQAIRRKLAK